jgi:hypothetical protein
VKIIIVFLVFAVIAGMDVPGLIQKRYWRELAVYGLILTTGLLLSLMMAWGIKIPPFGTAISDLIKELTGIQ